MKGSQPKEVTSVEAAVRLRLSRERVIRLIQIGALPGRRDPMRGWVVEEAGLMDQSAIDRTA